MWTWGYLVITGVYAGTIMYLNWVRCATRLVARKISLALMIFVSVLWGLFYILLASPVPTVNQLAPWAPFIQVPTAAVFVIMATVIRKQDTLEREAEEDIDA